MRFFAALVLCLIALQATYGFQPARSPSSSLYRTKLMEKVSTDDAAEVNPISKNVLPVVASTTGLLLSMGIDPAWAAKELPPDTSYIGKDFTAAFLPAILTPLVGLVFPAFSMALFFLYSQQDDLESA